MDLTIGSVNDGDDANEDADASVDDGDDGAKDVNDGDRLAGAN